MSHLPDGMPLPPPGPDDAPFWEACQRRELRVMQCVACGTHRHPSTPICARCRSTATAWPEVPGTGTVFSTIVAAHPTHPALKGHGPYNIAVIHLDDAGDVRLVSNVMGMPPEQVFIGMRVRLHWDALTDGTLLPRFVRAEDGQDG